MRQEAPVIRLDHRDERTYRDRKIERNEDVILVAEVNRVVKKNIKRETQRERDGGRYRAFRRNRVIWRDVQRDGVRDRWR